MARSEVYHPGNQPLLNISYTHSLTLGVSDTSGQDVTPAYDLDEVAAQTKYYLVMLECAMCANGQWSWMIIPTGF